MLCAVRWGAPPSPTCAPPPHLYDNLTASLPAPAPPPPAPNTPTPPSPCRAAKIHFLIMGHLRKQIPYFGQKKAQDKLLDNLAQASRAARRGRCAACACQRQRGARAAAHKLESLVQWAG